MDHNDESAHGEQVVANDDDAEDGVAANERGQHADHDPGETCGVADRPLAGGRLRDPRWRQPGARIVGQNVEPVSSAVSEPRAKRVDGRHLDRRWRPELAGEASGTVRKAWTGAEAGGSPDIGASPVKRYRVRTHGRLLR